MTDRITRLLEAAKNLQELSKSKVKDYLKKQEPSLTKSFYSNKPDSIKTFSKRIKGQENALNKLEKKAKVNVTEDNLQELSKATVSAYIKKAPKSVRYDDDKKITKRAASMDVALRKKWGNKDKPVKVMATEANINETPETRKKGPSGPAAPGTFAADKAAGKYKALNKKFGDPNKKTYTKAWGKKWLKEDDIHESFDFKKLQNLVRAGLFDASKIALLKRALEKDVTKLNPQEKQSLSTLLDTLLDMVTNNQQLYHKVRQNVMTSENTTVSFQKKGKETVDFDDGWQSAPSSSKGQKETKKVGEPIKEDNLQELSNKKLGSYIKKASDDRLATRGAFTKQKNKGPAMFNSGKDWENYVGTSGKSNASLERKIDNRKKGVRLAAKKIVKNVQEENLQELTGKGKLEKIEGQNLSKVAMNVTRALHSGGDQKSFDFAKRHAREAAKKVDRARDLIKKRDKVNEGILKKIKRSFQGWPSTNLDGKDGKPMDVRKRAKALAKKDPEMARMIAHGSTKGGITKHSPNDIQQRTLKHYVKEDKDAARREELHDRTRKYPRNMDVERRFDQWLRDSSKHKDDKRDEMNQARGRVKKEIKESVAKLLDKKTLTVPQLAKKHNTNADTIRKALKHGTSVEKEHTSKASVAKEIASDHIGEKPDYYKKLKAVE